MIIFLALNFGASDHGAVTAVMCGVFQQAKPYTLEHRGDMHGPSFRVFLERFAFG
jgi:hypothetical protein